MRRHQAGGPLAALLRLCEGLAAIMLLGCPPESAAPNAPRLTVEATTYDFASVEQGTQVTHAFPLRNSGGADLIITNLKTASDCTAEIAPRVISAGASGSLQTAFDSARGFGTTSRTITVYSNDPAQPVITLTLRGEIAVDVAADPPALYLGHVRRGATGENQARIVTGRPLTLRIQPDQGRTIRATLIDTPPGRSLSVTIRPDAPLGRFSESTTIVTTSSRHPTLTVPIVGFVDAEKD